MRRGSSCTEKIRTSRMSMNTSCQKFSMMFMPKPNVRK